MQKRYEHIVITTNLNDYENEIMCTIDEGWELIQVMPMGDLSVKIFMKRPIMDSDLSNIIVSDPNHKAALKSAVQSIWFNDRSDYLTGLYEVVSRLTGMEDIGYDTVEKLYKELNPEKDH